MSRVEMDAGLQAKLNGARGGVEFVDAAGNVVGHFLTAEEYARLLYDLAWQAVSEDEITEARKEMLEHGGVSTEELLAHLDAAKRDWEARQ